MPEAGLPARLVIGAPGGTGAACVCHPLDVVRVQLQVSRGVSVPEVLRRTGVPGLWSGLSAAILRQWTYGALRMGLFAWLLDRDRERRGAEDPGTARALPALGGRPIHAVRGRPAGQNAVDATSRRSWPRLQPTALTNHQQAQQTR